MCHHIDHKKDTCLQHESYSKKAEHCLNLTLAGKRHLTDVNFLQVCTCLRMTVTVPRVPIWAIEKLNFSEYEKSQIQKSVN